MPSSRIHLEWLDMQLETGQVSRYRYHFEQAPPGAEGRPKPRARYHSADIEYACFETLDSKKTSAMDRRRQAVKVSVDEL